MLRVGLDFGTTNSVLAVVDDRTGCQVVQHRLAAPGGVEIAGLMDDQPSVTNYVVTPVVGLVSEPPAGFKAQESEVLELFEVKLDLLLDPDRSYQEWWDASRMPAGADKEKLFGMGSLFAHCDASNRRYGVDYFQPSPETAPVIWGLTARILERFLHRVFGFRISER